MIGNDPGYQAWKAALDRQMQIYQDQTNRARDALSYIAAPQSPASYGYGRMANALTARAGAPNNPSTALFGASNPEAANLMLAQYMMQAPGGNTIGLPGSDAVAGNSIDWSNPLIQRLLGQTGVG